MVLLSAALLYYAQMVLVSAIDNIEAAVVETKADSPEIFTADFSSLKGGVISTSDVETVDALQSKFIFYYWEKGYYFERLNANGYLCL